MNQIKTFQVFPSIPEPLKFLEVLSRNIWWSWQYDAVELYRRIDPRLWEKSGRNPMLFFTYLSQERLEELSEDTSFLSHLERVKTHYEHQILNFGKRRITLLDTNETIAYFSMEFGIHESIPLFAGGLGVLAGDHLKAASDMGVPITGVGLLYHHGYFRQFLNQDGWQQEEYPETDIFYLPIQKVKDASGKDVSVTINGPDADIIVHIWKLMVGRIPLYLLDTNIHENPPHIREITSKLYAGDAKVRVAQEIVLGIGGIRALYQMGIPPTVVHLNEGHCAFASIERLAQIMEKHQIDLKTALEIVPRTTAFTTHTPVAAGNEEFPPELVRPYMVYYKDRFGISEDEILSWGQRPGASRHTPISMFVLGARMARYCNAVSRLHGKVSRRMWAHIWPGIPEEEVPITHVTNGIHIPTWISYENSLIFERYIGKEWNLHPSSADTVGRINDIYDEELWRAHSMSRSRLIRNCRRLMVKQYKRRNAPKHIIKEAESVLDHDILTIAFARRFTTYKRANLLLRDPERLKAIIMNKDYPVQFIFAGKAHPRDNEGKDLIRQIIQFAQIPEVRHRFIFIEDYDIHLARHLVHGADVWLNNPRRPFEACGTSGMKAAINGVLNVSILDGWWDEGYAEGRGWKIGDGDELSDYGYQDAIESQAMYNVLENEVIPCFYERENGDVPKRWLQMMKESIKMGMRFFCSHRMVAEYESRFYMPAEKQMKNLLKNNAEEAVKLAIRSERLRQVWSDIRIDNLTINPEGPFQVGDIFRVGADIHLGRLLPDEVQVECYYGILKTVDSLSDCQSEMMELKETIKEGTYRYQQTIECKFSGRCGFTIRVIPKGDAWTKNMPGLITWA